MTAVDMQTNTSDNDTSGGNIAHDGVEIFNGGYFQYATPVGSGTGQYFTFLAIQNKDNEQGYNVDTSSTQVDVSKTTTLPIANLQVVTNPGGGLPNGSYYEIRMDLNEPNGGTNEITLTSFKLFSSVAPAGAGLNFATSTPPNFTQLYDMGAGNSILMSAHSSGSGDDDYAFFIPTSSIAGHSGYLTLFAAFTNADSGFEEFRAVATAGPPVLSIVKTVTSVTGGVGTGNLTADNAGDVVNYSVAVNNTGAMAATNVVVKDSLPDVTLKYVSGDTNTNNALDVGETWIYTGSHTVTQAELDTKGGGDGDIDNTATVTTTELPNGLSSSTSSPLAYNPSFTVVKTVASVTGGVGPDSLTADSAGDKVNYSVAVHNTGNVDLSVTNVADSLGDVSLKYVSGDTGNDSVLGVGETWIYTGTHTVTQTELDTKGGGDGDIDNTATITTAEDGALSSSTSSPLAYNPSFTVVKTVASVTGGVGPDSLTADNAGDKVNYSVAVHNTGNVDLTVTNVADSLGDVSLKYVSGDTGNDSVLGVGETWIYTGTHTVTQTELDTKGGGDGDIDNTATITTAEDGALSSSTSSPLAYNPSFTVVKTVASVDGGVGADSLTADNAGDKVNYSVAVHNTGNVDLTVTNVADSLGDVSLKYVSGDTGNDSVLGVGETWIYTGTHTVTQTELDTKGGGDNDIDNTATITTDLAGALSSSTSSPLAYNPSFTVVKTVASVTGGVGPDSLTADNAGDKVNYSVAVHNTGNVDLTVTNVADSLGDVSLKYVSGDTGNDSVLGVGETWIYTGTHTVTQTELDTKGGGDGDIDNTATITTDLAGSHDSSTSSPLAYNPSFTVVKTVASVTGGVGADSLTADSAGDKVNYSVAVHNTGNVDLSVTNVADSLGDVSLKYVSGDTGNDSVLGVGETWIYTGTHTVTQTELDTKGGGDGDIDNTATITTDLAGSHDSSTSSPLAYNPSFTVVKTVASVTGGVGADSLTADSAGDKVNYSVAVHNTGNVDLSVTNVADSLGDVSLKYVSGDTGNDSVLGVGETWIYTGTHTVTQTELDTKGGGDGDIDNTATITTDLAGSHDSSTASPLAYLPHDTILKTVSSIVGGPDNHTVDSPGDVINYNIVVTNDGNVDLTHVVLTDPLTNAAIPLTLFSGDTGNDSVLSVGESWTYHASYTVTQADFDNNGGGDGDIDNTATVVTDQTGPISSSVATDIVMVGPGVRTPGFWANMNNGGTFWDGVAGNSKSGPNFPAGELANDTIQGHPGAGGILIGDWNHDGIANDGPGGSALGDLYISHDDAMTLINASQKQQGDARYMLARDLVASWLNDLAGNGVGLASDPDSPRSLMTDAITWLNKTTNNDGVLTVSELNTGAIKTNSSVWTTDQFGLDRSGSQMHTELDYYNNTGQTLMGGIHYANDADG